MIHSEHATGSMIQREVVYLHKYEYRERDAKGNWTEPEIRYANATTSLTGAVRRHKECQDSTHEMLGGDAYSWANCRLVKRTITTTTLERELTHDCQ